MDRNLEGERRRRVLIEKYKTMGEIMKKMGTYLNSLSPKEKEMLFKKTAIKMALAAELFKDKESANDLT